MALTHHRQVRAAGPLAGACAISLASLSTPPAAAPPAAQPTVAYEDPAAAGQPDAAVAILTWTPDINVMSIDGSAPDPATLERRARLAPGHHEIYFFGTVAARGVCLPVTGDELAVFEAQRGRSYAIAARQPARTVIEGDPTPGCRIELTVGEVTGPEPALWPKERLAGARAAAAERLRRELQRTVQAAADGDPEAAVNLALWYLLGDEPLAPPDPVAAEIWLLVAEGRGSERAKRLRADLEPTLTSAQRRSAAERAKAPPVPALGAQEIQR